MSAESDAVRDEKENRSTYGRMDRRPAVSREQVDWEGWLAGRMGGWVHQWVGGEVGR